MKLDHGEDLMHPAFFFDKMVMVYYWKRANIYGNGNVKSSMKRTEK